MRLWPSLLLFLAACCALFMIYSSSVFLSLNDSLPHSYSYLSSFISTPVPQMFSEKWVILASSSASIDRRWFNLTGWSILWIGDSPPSDPEWDLCRYCLFLGPQHQEGLKYEITELLPQNHASRKNIGYLYAIEHNAALIYDADSLEYFPNVLLNLPVNQKRDLYAYYESNNKLVNPFKHFGQVGLWPRGYPLNQLGDQSEVSTLQVTDLDIGILHYLCPALSAPLDLDSVFQLTRVQCQDKLPTGALLHSTVHETYTEAIGTFGLLPYVYTPWNSKSTLFYRSSFWALFLPSSVPSSVSDIWRGYFAQRLLWEIGDHLAVSLPPIITEKERKNSRRRLNKSYAFPFGPSAQPQLYDFNQELHMYQRTPQLTSTLSEWKCNSPLFRDCVLNLGHLMLREKFWNVNDLKLAEFWLKATEKFTKTERPKPGAYNVTGYKTVQSHKGYSRAVSLWKELPQVPSLSFTKLGYQIPHEEREVFSDLTPGQYTELKQKLESVLLIIHFQYPPMPKILPFLVELYQPFFTHIAYVASTPTTESDIQYINCPAGHTTHLQHRCFAQVLGDPKVQDAKYTGYFWFNYDGLLQPQLMYDMDLTKLWFSFGSNHEYGMGNDEIAFYREWKLTDKGPHAYWVPWIPKEIEKLKLVWPKIPSMYRERYLQNAGGVPYVIHNSISEIFYFPDHLSMDFLTLLPLFNEADVNCEFTIPAVFASIITPEQYQPLNKKGIFFPFWHLEESAWYDMTKFPPASFERSNWRAWVGAVPNRMFYYPLGLSSAYNRDNVTEFVTRNWRIRKRPFDTIALVIHFSFPPNPGVVPFLMKLYSPYFTHIYYISSKPAEDWTTQNYVFCPQKKWAGRLMYDCLRLFMHKVNFQFGGYFWINDDVYLQPHIFIGLDINKVWYPWNANHEAGMGPASINFYPFSMLGNDTIKVALNWIAAEAQKVRVTFRELPEEYQNRYIALAGNYMIANALADVFYLPASGAFDFATMSPYFTKNDVFLEYAVPVMLAVIVGKSANYESLHDKGMYLPYWPLPEFAWKDLTSHKPAPFHRPAWKEWLEGVPNRGFYHPIKFSNPQALEVVKKLVAANWPIKPKDL